MTKIRTVSDARREKQLADAVREDAADRIGELVRNGRTVYYFIEGGIYIEGASRAAVLDNLVQRALADNEQEQAGDSDEPEGYKPEGAVMYDGTPGSGSWSRS